jgi:hypothetical protein
LTTYRREVHRTLKFGTAGAFTALQAEKNKLLVEAGCTPYKVWCPAFGELHHLVLEATFTSLDAYEAQDRIIGGLGRVKAIDAQLIEHVMPGTAYDKLSKVVLDTEDAA